MSLIVLPCRIIGQYKIHILPIAVRPVVVNCQGRNLAQVSDFSRQTCIGDLIG